jgi:hypothetical protein
MFRTLTVTALFTLSLATAAYADSTAQSLNSRILQAAQSACAPLLDSSHGSLLYKKWFADCVSMGTARITAQVAALSPTSTALLQTDNDRR